MSQGPRGGTLLAALAVGLCCGAPVIIASGAIGVLGGWFARAWPLVLVGGSLLGYGLYRWGRRARLVRARSERP